MLSVGNGPIWLAAAAFFIGVLALYAAVIAFPTMWLWNWLMPDLFGLKTIDFWQALGLNLLTGFLFKSSCSHSK